METLVYAWNAVTPLLLLIAFGYVLKRIGKWDSRFFSSLNGFCYRILLPIQLFYNVYRIEALGDVNWRVIGYAVAWIPIAILIGVLLAGALIKERGQRGALVQASFRSNQAIMGLPLAESLGGASAVAVASIATSVGIPLFNVSAVIILKAYSDARGEKSSKGTLKALLTNPLILGVLAGIFALVLREFIPTVDGELLFSIQNDMPPLYTVIKNLSAVASPVMLICLGASLDFGLTGRLMPKIALGVALRLIVIPALAIGVAVLLKEPLGLTTAHMPMLVAFFASPVAVSSAILVREMGGDEQYASQLVIWSSVFSILTLFVFVAILRNMALL